VALNQVCTQRPVGRRKHHSTPATNAPSQHFEGLPGLNSALNSSPQSPGPSIQERGASATSRGLGGASRRNFGTALAVDYSQETGGDLAERVRESIGAERWDEAFTTILCLLQRRAPYRDVYQEDPAKDDLDKAVTEMLLADVLGDKLSTAADHANRAISSVKLTEHTLCGLLYVVHKLRKQRQAPPSSDALGTFTPARTDDSTTFEQPNVGLSWSMDWLGNGQQLY
jgi:hypothetical protein